MTCHDCHIIYEDFPLDTIVPDDLWARISPTGDRYGLLCANCMVARIAQLDPSPVIMKLTPVWIEEYDE